MNDTNELTDDARYAALIRLTGAKATWERYHHEDCPHDPQALTILRVAGIEIPAFDHLTKAIVNYNGDVCAFDTNAVVVWERLNPEHGQDKGETR